MREPGSDEVAATPRPRRARVLGGLVGVGLVAAVIGGYALATSLWGGTGGREPAARAAAAPIPPVVTEAGLASRAGVRIVHVAVTGGGGLIDLRYLVLDADRAAAVHGSAPELVDERTGALADRQLMGHRNRGVLHAGQTYYLIFQNPGNLVQRGSRVTVALGGLRVRHVVVQ